MSSPNQIRTCIRTRSVSWRNNRFIFLGSDDDKEVEEEDSNGELSLVCDCWKRCWWLVLERVTGGLVALSLLSTASSISEEEDDNALDMIIVLIDSNNYIYVTVILYMILMGVFADGGC